MALKCDLRHFSLCRHSYTLKRFETIVASFRGILVHFRIAHGKRGREWEKVREVRPMRGGATHPTQRATKTTLCDQESPTVSKVAKVESWESCESWSFCKVEKVAKVDKVAKSKVAGKVESRKSWGTSKSKVALMFPKVDSRQSRLFYKVGKVAKVDYSSESVESESCSIVGESDKYLARMSSAL